MKKNVLIVSTSPRKGSNSDALAEEFARGARDAGHQVEKLSLIGKDLRFCQGCLSCVRTGRCPIPDDAPPRPDNNAFWNETTRSWTSPQQPPSQKRPKQQPG